MITVKSKKTIDFLVINFDESTTLQEVLDYVNARLDEGYIVSNSNLEQNINELIFEREEK